MMKIQYVLLDPTGNRTILVETPVKASEQPSVAAKLMECEPSAEQVGFIRIDGERAAMRMAGGEFCGNAAMSAAALVAELRGIRKGLIPVSVIGTPEPVTVQITKNADSWQGTVQMPRPVRIGTETFPDGRAFPVVRFDGICHVITDPSLSREEAERLAPEWCAFLKAEAVGILLFDRAGGTLTPLVYVPMARTLCWENSCASGTTAIGAYLAACEGNAALALRQPGGTLRIETDPEGRLLLTGRVRRVYRKSVEIAE